MMGKAMDDLLKKYQGVAIKFSRTLEWENLGGHWPDYAITENDGKVNTFGFWLYRIVIHQAFTKDMIISDSKISFEDAATKALTDMDEQYKIRINNDKP
jgi:hypothetical protein